MSAQTATNRFIVPPEAKSVRFYQELISGALNYESLGTKLVGLCEHARMLRQLDTASQLGQILSNFPLKKYQAIGQYYLALDLYQNGQGDVNKAQVMLESVASVAGPKYRAEALLSLAGMSLVSQNPADTFTYYSEATKVGASGVVTINALRGLAVLKSFEGYHRFALRDLESLYPIIKYAPPHIYFDYMNSLAVELAECGRLDEAGNVSKIACSSPLVSVYPEWRETANEIALRAYKSRSSVSVAQPASENIVPLPVPEEKPPTQTEPARVLSYLDWKKKMGQEDYNSMTETDLVFRIFRLASEQSDNWLRLRKIVDYILKVSSEPC